MEKMMPSMDEWLSQAKEAENADLCGMYLFHNGVVRKTAKAKVREGKMDLPEVSGIYFDYDSVKLEQAIAKAKALPGIYHVRVWLNRGELDLGDSIMQVLVGGDIRPHVIDALQSLVGEIKQDCVREEERYR